MFDYLPSEADVNKALAGTVIRVIYNGIFSVSKTVTYLQAASAFKYKSEVCNSNQTIRQNGFWRLNLCEVYYIFCNLLFALSGLLILIVGAMVQLNYAHYSNFVSNHIWTVPIILIIVGATIAFICFLGCCGALKENSCMILSFAILAVIIFLFEIGLGIAGYVKHASLSDIMEEQFNSTMKEYNERKENRDAWSLLQSEMDCCGTFGPKDWEPIFHNSSLPPACCAVINLNEAQDCTVVHAHSEGCLNKLLTLLDSKTLTLAGVVLGVAGIQLLTILFAFCLFRSFRRSYQTV